ncbi:LINE-1 retrotransposable element ORF2 protein, partial [Linum perenne]
NCRGAGSKSFLNALNFYLQNHKPAIVVILEPRISGLRGQTVRKKIGFQNSFVVEAEGFRGGIWLMWNDADFTIRVLDSSSQFNHVSVEWELGKSCVLTLVYASPQLSRRRLLWQDLARLGRSTSLAWMALGDFNAIVDSSEKFGGAGFNRIQAQEFRDCISECGFLDMGFSGPKFTWFRKNLRERLDRSLCNAAWMSFFPDATNYHLERLKSDHRPLLVRLIPSVRYNKSPRPFRFNAAWLGHDEFPSFLDLSWKRGRNICASLQGFEDDCRNWNSEVFGHIFKRKRYLEGRLKWLESRNQSSFSEEQARTEEEVRAELEKTLWQENMLWLQKSRLQWIRDGDRNTKFFHLSTLKRRKFNAIKGLKREDGSWCFDERELQELAISHFQNLFRAGTVTELQGNGELTGFTCPIPEAVGEGLGMAPSETEIFSIIKSMGRLKAPGKDGFHPIFFQKCWKTVGPDVANFVSSCFRYPEMVEQVNETIIVLIPKLAKLEAISQFRPISLCNVVYKTITKCIADRLKPHMVNLVGEAQTSFVPGRQITDNIIILQEVLHTMRQQFGKKGSMTIKIDLAKAYDRLEWSFIEETLKLARIPDKLVKLIMACISTVSTQVLWNGS